VVGVAVLDIDATQYLERTAPPASGTRHRRGQRRLFGVLVALSGCLRGMQATGARPPSAAATSRS
jgi:ABC-type transporter Mla maintaining outer membrane lipid asymmetry permease subunit MlaE